MTEEKSTAEDERRKEKKKRLELRSALNLILRRLRIKFIHQRVLSKGVAEPDFCFRKTSM